MYDILNVMIMDMHIYIYICYVCYIVILLSCYVCVFVIAF